MEEAAPSVSTPETVPTEAEVLTNVARHLIAAASPEGLRRLQDALPTIQAEVSERLGRPELSSPTPTCKPRTVRILLPGCFDMMHAGHYNALRQAKSVCASEGVDVVLVAGVHNDAAILEQKGPTVFKDPERIALVTACKWVDEVAVDLPYLINPELLDSLNCDFVAHGDDLPTRSDGTSVYGTVIEAGRFKLIKRTEGVSTTTLIGRLLSMSKDHLIKNSGIDEGANELRLISTHSSMLPTMSRLVQFRGESRPRDAAQRVVYVDGAFDLFHVGHMEFLKKARELGDYLLDMCERALCVLAMAAVDDVVIGAPWVVTQELVTSLGISIVGAGSLHKTQVADHPDALPEPYAYPAEKGILRYIESGSTITTENVVERIIQSRQVYEARNATRAPMEAKYKENKEYVAEQ